jgi:hypothetical protein
VHHEVITSSVETRSPVVRSAFSSKAQPVFRLRVGPILVCCTVLASTVAGLMLSAGAAAATPCAEAVLADWYVDGRIDRLYAFPCYEQAIDAVPSEIRDYTDAQEVISRAFHAATGQRIKERTTQGPVGPAPPTSVPPVVVTTASPGAMPIPLLVLAGLATTLLVAGGLGYVSRRRGHDLDSRRDGDRTNRTGGP